MRMSTPVRIPKSSSSPISKAGSKSSQSRSSSSCSSSHSSPKSAGTSSKDGTHRRHSRPELMSPSLKSQDDYLVYEILSGDSENGLGSVVIIPKSSQGFSWNEGNRLPPENLRSKQPLMVDVFLSKYHLNNLASPKRLSSSGEYRTEEGIGSSGSGSSDEDFVDVHEIHIEDDNMECWWDDLP